MKKLYFVTTNLFKLKQASEIFNNIFDIEGIKLDIVEIQTLDQELISKYKARQAFEILKQPVIVDDSGIFIKKYNNFPSVLTAYASKGLGIDGILTIFNDDDAAEFRSVITYIDSMNEITVSANIEGTLIKRDRLLIDKKNIFGSLFRVNGVNKFMNELNEEELKKYSHRGKALEQLKNKIRI